MTFFFFAARGLHKRRLVAQELFVSFLLCDQTSEASCGSRGEWSRLKLVTTAIRTHLSSSPTAQCPCPPRRYYSAAIRTIYFQISFISRYGPIPTTRFQMAWIDACPFLINSSCKLASIHVVLDHTMSDPQSTDRAPLRTSDRCEFSSSWETLGIDFVCSVCASDPNITLQSTEKPRSAFRRFCWC